MTFRKQLLLLALCSVLTSGATAQTVPQKIATIDLRKVFDNYWKTKQADANLKDHAGDLDKERKSLVEQYTKSQEIYKKLADGANDQAVSAEERAKRKKGAEDELMKLKEIENQVGQFDRTAKTTLGEQQRRMRDNILVEIKDAIKAKAKAGGYSFVIDSAADSVNSTPVLIYTSGENDLTDVVLVQLNLTAPAGFKSGDANPPKEEKK